MVKYVCKYIDGKLSSVYTKGVKEGIIVGFQKDKFGNHNSRLVNICVLIQILLRILHFK